MIVQCISNNKLDFKNSSKVYEILNANYLPIDSPVNLAIGKIFVVYSIISDRTMHKFYVEDTNKKSGIFFHDIFFKVIDSRISRYWDQKYHLLNWEAIQKISEKTEISFKEWINDSNFYYKLIENDEVPGVFSKKEAELAVRLFQKYKALMDLEFAFPTVTESAVSLDYNLWILCPSCDETWEDPNASIHEMVKCPKCTTLYLSPFLIKERFG